MGSGKRIAILAILIPVAVLLLRMPVKAAAPFEDLKAQAALLAEADTGTVLFEQNANTRHPADGLAKVMTMILAISAIEEEKVSTDDYITMTESALADITSTSTTQKIVPGEEMKLIDLLYCAIVGNANEACNLIAEYISGSIGAFVEQMNQRANELGCKGTNFTNPHGQYNENQYTTASDQFLIYREALSHPLFEEISGTYRYTTADTNKADPRRLTVSNSLFNTAGKYFYRPCTSYITSGTFEGGYSFAGYAESEGLSLITVVLGSDVVINKDESADMRNLTESARLFSWGFSEFGWRVILSSAEPIAKAPVEHGAGADYVNLRPEKEIKELIDKDIPDKDFKSDIVIYSERDNKPLVAPVEAGDVLGEVKVTRYDATTKTTINYGTVKLVANTGIELHRLEFIRLQAAELLSSSTARFIIWALIIIVFGYAALVIRYNVIRIKRKQRIAEAKRKLIEEHRQEEEREYSNQHHR